MRTGGEASALELVVVDEDVAAAAALARGLDARGYRVTLCAARDLLQQVATRAPDAVVMEIAYRDLDGLALILELRARLGAPILVCSSTRRVDDAPVALAFGADGFVRKPCDPAELAERISVLVRRGAGPSSSRLYQRSRLHVGSLVLNPRSGQASVAGTPVQLTPTEFRLLVALASTPGQVVRHDRLARSVWDYPDAHTTLRLSTHVQSVRAKLLRHDPGAPRITAVRKVGYALLTG
jgi:DNA-binding response OmpR family regulator